MTIRNQIDYKKLEDERNETSEKLRRLEERGIMDEEDRITHARLQARVETIDWVIGLLE